MFQITGQLRQKKESSVSRKKNQNKMTCAMPGSSLEIGLYSSHSTQYYSLSSCSTTRLISEDSSIGKIPYNQYKLSFKPLIYAQHLHGLDNVLHICCFICLSFQTIKISKLWSIYQKSTCSQEVFLHLVSEKHFHIQLLFKAIEIKKDQF